MAIAGFVRKMSGSTDLDTDSMNKYVSTMVEEALKYSNVESIKNPLSGVIRIPGVGEIIMDIPEAKGKILIDSDFCNKEKVMII